MSVLTGSGRRGNREKERERAEEQHSRAGATALLRHAASRKIQLALAGRGRVLQKRGTQMKCHFSVQRQQQRQSKIYRRRQADKQTERDGKREREEEREMHSVEKRTLCGCVFCCCFCLLNMKHLIGKLQQIACNIIERATERIVQSGERRGESGARRLCVRPVAHRQLAACGRHTLATN